MGPTALQIAGTGAVSAVEYRGATTAARFGNPQEEWAEFRAGCAVYDLGFRAKITLTGSDRVRWLNGMVTNNIRDLAPGRGEYAFLLNPQGHILGDLYAYNRGDSIIIDTDQSQLEKILATFDHYIIMDDVEVANASDQITAVGLAGPRARAVLQSAGLKFPELQPLQLHIVECNCDCGCVTCTIVRGEEIREEVAEKTNEQVSGGSNSESYEIWLAPAQVKPLWDALLASGATPVGSEALELQRIVSGRPLYRIDIRERDLPQETEQARALNFNKGCYIGQEIVERIRSRGAVHRKFTGFIVDGAAPVHGTKILANEKEVGEVTSAATVQFQGRDTTVALGYIRREAGSPGGEVVIGTSPAQVAHLPIENSVLREGISFEHQRA